MVGVADARMPVVVDSREDMNRLHVHVLTRVPSSDSIALNDAQYRIGRSCWVASSPV
jgi:hypothetical protein